MLHCIDWVVAFNSLKYSNPTQEHHASGCIAQPVFGMEPNSMLCMQCKSCGALEVVL